MAETLTMKKLQEQIDELKKEISNLKSERKNDAISLPKGLKVGDKFTLAEINWTIIDITDAGYKCLADKLNKDMQFDKDKNDWREAALRDYLYTEVYPKIADVIGENNIIPFERDLTSLDGQIEYDVCEDRISFLTVDEYRKYRKHIPNADYWWWIITPWSTPCNDYKTSVTVVSPSGRIFSSSCNCYYGVRPVCIFSSAIFESEE